MLSIDWLRMNRKLIKYLHQGDLNICSIVCFTLVELKASVTEVVN